MEKRSEGCNFCNVPLFIEVQQVAQPILAPLTPAAAAWDEWVSKSGRNYVQLTSQFCPMCGREKRPEGHTDLIRRSDLLKYAHDVTLANGAKHRCIDATVIHEIRGMEARPERHGYWMRKRDDPNNAYCSECNCAIGASGWPHEWQLPFCYQCGAMMDTEVKYEKDSRS